MSDGIRVDTCGLDASSDGPIAFQDASSSESSAAASAFLSWMLSLRVRLLVAADVRCCVCEFTASTCVRRYANGSCGESMLAVCSGVGVSPGRYDSGWLRESHRSAKCPSRLWSESFTLNTRRAAANMAFPSSVARDVVSWEGSMDDSRRLARSVLAVLSRAPGCVTGSATGCATGSATGCAIGCATGCATGPATGCATGATGCATGSG